MLLNCVVQSRLILAWSMAMAMSIPWSAELLRKPAEWYESAEARAIADSVLQHQSRDGAWPKNTDLATAPAGRTEPGVTNTIDNGATTMPMRFLALVATATNDPRYRASFERGMKYLLAAQYPNGGWPQFYPLRDGYYSHVTFNDDAMVNVLELLRDAAAGSRPFAFVDRNLRKASVSAVSRGTDIILRTQIRQDGRLTGWCAQYDEKTLEPAWARNYEPPSLSGSETVGIVRFLMGIERPSPAIVAAVDGAVSWLDAVAIKGKRVQELTDADGRDRRVVDDPSAEPLWARFYELGTNRPIFIGRDRVIRDDFNQIERERRVGYAYYGRWPARLLSEEYPRWRVRLRGAR